MYRLMKSLDYEIPDNYKLIGYVTYANTREAIIKFFTDPNNRAEDTLFFYFSGHGVPDGYGDTFLATSELDPGAPYDKGFSFDELTKMIKRSVSVKIVVLLDCCYSGAAKLSLGSGDAQSMIGRHAIEQGSEKIQGEGKYIMAASQDSQEAYVLAEGDHIIFSYFLLEGLKGNDKSIDSNGNVTAHSLGNYVYRSIVNLPPNKKPNQKPKTKSASSGDIILASYPKSSLHYRMRLAD